MRVPGHHVTPIFDERAFGRWRPATSFLTSRGEATKRFFRLCVPRTGDAWRTLCGFERTALINDSYNSIPAALRSDDGVLLAATPNYRRGFFAAGEMRELGAAFQRTASGSGNFAAEPGQARLDPRVSGDAAEIVNGRCAPFFQAAQRNIFETP